VQIPVVTTSFINYTTSTVTLAKKLTSNTRGENMF